LNVTFSTSKLQKLANDFKKCQREMGPARAKLFNKRLTDLNDAESLADVKNLPGKYHELTGNRKGQWSCDLDQPYRLIFRPCEDPIPTNENGQYIWLEIVDVEIIEIVDYH
jgi:proteic killer suppression protein